jgi:hypothetical protein
MNSIGRPTGDCIETSIDMIQSVIPMLFQYYKVHGFNRRMKVLDPCYSRGTIKKHFAKYSSWIEFIHHPEMTLGGEMELNEGNLELFKSLDPDVVLTNPPFSVKPLAIVMENLLKLSDNLNIPVVFLLPSKRVETYQFCEIAHDRTFSKNKIPQLNFDGYKNGTGCREKSNLYWFFLNFPDILTSKLSKYVVQNKETQFAYQKNVELYYTQ